MNDQHAQYRHCHLGGAVYLTVEGLLWLFSASLGATGRIPAAMLTLLIGGMLIHPIATACSRLLRLPTPDGSNQLPILNTWLALTIPLGLPLIFMATSSGREDLFFPAFAVLVGAHWLPFTYIYSMKSFLALASSLVLAGTLFAFVFTQSCSTCGFVVGGIHFLFAIIHYSIIRREKEASNSG
ncbi:MAG: hypothetical protein DRJ65_19655 [Acidobacteria bacterium]|nr:MAG: hypothetical protein DRJ65_19655 [Acidobacteriota bacterium]